MASIDHARTLHPNFLRFCVGMCILGILAAVVSNVVGSVLVPEHDWVADTISDLGAGQYEYIQDYGLYMLAAGLLGLALAAAHFHAGLIRWSAGVLGLSFGACLIVVIAARNEYGDGDSEGVELHRYFVLGLAVVGLIVPLLMAKGLATRSRLAARAGQGIAVLWSLSAVVFWFLMPDGYDGLWERGMFGLMGAFLIILCVHFWRGATDIANAERPAKRGGCPNGSRPEGSVSETAPAAPPWSS